MNETMSGYILLMWLYLICFLKIIKILIDTADWALRGYLAIKSFAKFLNCRIIHGENKFTSVFVLKRRTEFFLLGSLP